MNIGILGGSFDPIHNGHIHMAECAYREFQLEEVWLIPTGHSPNKDEGSMTEAFHRFHMCEIAAGQFPWLQANSLEIESYEKSYTYRTLEKLTKRYPLYHFFFIMGADSLDYFEKWVHPEIIAQLCTILVIPRNASPASELAAKAKEIESIFPCDIRTVSCSQYPVSSTAVRQNLKNGKYNDYELLPEVFYYIQKNHLYGT